MVVVLPDGVRPTLRALTDDQVLTDSIRTVAWRFELLDRDERPTGTLDGVGGGSVDWTANASIKGGGQLDVTDAGQAIDWLNIRIRPVCTIDGLSREVPAGIWLAAAPVEQWTSTGRSWSVDLLDKASILDGDVWSDDSGAPATFTAVAGSNVVTLVRDLIVSAGESASAIEDDPATLTRAMVWDIGTSRLRIINDLLDAAGFFSLWVDLAGQFQVTRYTSPADRPPLYEAVGPFLVMSGRSVWSQDYTMERDIFAVPNRVLAIAQGDGESEAMTATASNTDPDSPYSFTARGRWVTVVESDVEAVDQQALDLYAIRRLSTLTSVTAALSVAHPFLPDLTVNSVVALSNPAASLDLLASVSKTSVTFDPLALCSTELREVTRL